MDAATLGRSPYRGAPPPGLTPSMSRNTSISRQKSASWTPPHQRGTNAPVRACRNTATPPHSRRIWWPPDGTPQQHGPARRGTYARRRAPTGYAGDRAPSSHRSCGACLCAVVAATAAGRASANNTCDSARCRRPGATAGPRTDRCGQNILPCPPGHTAARHYDGPFCMESPCARRGGTPYKKALTAFYRKGLKFWSQPRESNSSPADYESRKSAFPALSPTFPSLHFRAVSSI